MKTEPCFRQDHEQTRSNCGLHAMKKTLRFNPLMLAIIALFT
jgi:hypothetical protein